MSDMIKGFFLLVLLIISGTFAYVAWLVFVPVSESDAEFRLANVCYGGQMLSAALKGADHRPTSCACVQDRLVGSLNPAGLAKGVDAVRQIFVAHMWSLANGEKPGEPDNALVADRDILTFIAALHRLDRDCKVSPFSAAKR